MNPAEADRIFDYVTRLGRQRFGLCTEEAQDVAQDVLIASWKHFGDQEPPPAGWIRGASLLQCRMLLRAKIRRRNRESEYSRRARHQCAPPNLDLILDARTVIAKVTGTCEAANLVLAHEPLAAVASACNIASGTLYRRLKDWRDSSSPSKALA